MDISLLYKYDSGNLLNKKTNHVYGNLDRDGYIRVRKDGKEYRAHRLIWQLFNGEIPEGMLIDHIDGNTSNNTIENLRLVTRQQNNANSKSTGTYPKGVTKVGTKYRARIWHLGVAYSLGTYSTPEEASETYNKKAIELNGEYARAYPHE